MKHEVQRQLPAKPSIEEAKQILQADQYTYTDEEITIIIHFIHRLAGIDLNIYEQSNPQIHHLKGYYNDYSKKSISISKSQHRRAG
ncbi:hypothetical protein [Chitinophaga rhizophila]|uniref:Uncharacterized protein n=1 Tax=Chitinophaga rhizophila TaxID=2866212 RepID=A0ABS7GAK1_9BACT|nr:hypothetical protein [Chitinophaga rhizophila]MBW8684684.1 hypothetical protein [Chitinophaga rhizophila]